MVAATNKLAGLGAFPSDGAREVSTSAARGFNGIIEAQIGTLPTDYTARINELLVVSDTGTVKGPVTAQDVAALLGADKQLGRIKPYMPRGIVTGNVALTDAMDGGGLIPMGNSSAATITIALSANPLLGVSSPFWCTILRLFGAATVQIAFSGVTSRNPNSHTRVVAARPATLILVGTDVYFDGYTAT